MSNSEIDKKVKSTLDAIDSIEVVKVSPFLKDRILNNLDHAPEKIGSIWSWYTPNLQLTTLLMFIMLNLFAYINMNSEDYDLVIDEFTETYELDIETESTFSNF